MRLSEKTLELNICAQVTKRARASVTWFGLTQKQEARAGFDACTKLGGRLLIFQFKAASRVLKSKKHMFLVPHDQLLALKARVKSHMRSVFYAFPLVCTTVELGRSNDLLGATIVVDVAHLPALAEPTTRKGVPRKNGCHNVYVDVAGVTFHSEPTEVPSFSLAHFVDRGFSGADGIGPAFDGSFENFWSFVQDLPGGSVGAVITN